MLGELRVINVYLPPGYADGKMWYPVLYLLDGGIDQDFPHIAGAVDVSVKNGVMRPFVVVGLKNTERRRDMTGPTERAEDRKIAPNAGGAEKFRRLLRDELKPLIAQRSDAALALRTDAGREARHDLSGRGVQGVAHAVRAGGGEAVAASRSRLRTAARCRRTAIRRAPRCLSTPPTMRRSHGANDAGESWRQANEAR